MKDSHPLSHTAFPNVFPFPRAVLLTHFTAFLSQGVVPFVPFGAHFLQEFPQTPACSSFRFPPLGKSLLAFCWGLPKLGIAADSWISLLPSQESRRSEHHSNQKLPMGGVLGYLGRTREESELQVNISPPDESPDLINSASPGAKSEPIFPSGDISRNCTLRQSHSIRNLCAPGGSWALKKQYF